jgi:hypothetical protein
MGKEDGRPILLLFWEAYMVKDRTMHMIAGVGAAASVLSVLIVLFSKNRVPTEGDYVRFPAQEFFQPEAVADLARSFDTGDVDESITAAWEWVGRNIQYEAVGSDIDFHDQYVTCLHCFTAEETLRRGQGNCVSKSALLGSMLIHYLSPADVRLVIGGFALDGVGGHCWLEVKRLGTWYLIEATSPPRSTDWVPSSLMSTTYLPYAVISMNGLDCRNECFCLEVGACDCQQRIRELL